MDFLSGTVSARIERKKAQGWTMDLQDMATLKMLPTPTSGADRNADYQQGGRCIKTGLMQSGLIPTPVCNDSKGKETSPSEAEKGSLSGMVARMIPTPRASEWKGTGPIGSKSHTHRVEKGYLDATMQEATGQSGQLNPLFVQEMMGFPKDWLVLPFLNGEKEPSGL